VAPKLPCPVEGCQNLRRRQHVMCGYHWSRVPRPLRDRICKLFRTDPRGEAHQAAVQEAITHVQVIQGG